MRKQRLFDMALAAVVVLTIANTARVFGLGESGTDRDMRDVEVVTDEGRARLGSVGPGSCRYVIIADPDCAACQSASEQWRSELARGLVVLPDSQGWTVMWLATDGMDGLRRLGLVGSQFFAYPLANPSQAINQIGVEAFPWHIVLDQDGDLVESGVGARLPAAEDFTADCSIRASASATLEVIG